MLGFFKKSKNKCEHDWHYIKDDYITEDPIYVILERGCCVFCPKCNTEKLVYVEEWEKIKTKQKIKQEYNVTN